MANEHCKVGRLAIWAAVLTAVFPMANAPAQTEHEPNVASNQQYEDRVYSVDEAIDASDGVVVLHHGASIRGRSSAMALTQLGVPAIALRGGPENAAAIIVDFEYLGDFTQRQLDDGTALADAVRVFRQTDAD